MSANYPSTTSAVQELQGAGIDVDQQPYKAMIEALEAYEHGNAQVSAIEALEAYQHGNAQASAAYAGILVDLALAIHFSS